MVRHEDVYAIRGALETRQELMKRLHYVEASGAELSIWGRYHRSDLSTDQKRELDDFANRFVRQQIADVDARLHKLGVFMEAPPVYGFNAAGLPIGVTYSAEKKAFLDKDGERLSHAFYEAWERRIHEFPEPAVNLQLFTIDELFTRHAELIREQWPDDGSAILDSTKAAIQVQMDAVAAELKRRKHPFAYEVGSGKIVAEGRGINFEDDNG